MNIKLMSLLLVGFLSIQCTQNSEIREEKVSQIIESLSSDEMKGRNAFSPDINKAASFIENEFKNIGLEKFDTLENYRQTFSIYSVTPGEGSVHINGKEIAPDSYFVQMYSEELKWTEEAVQKASISEQDNFKNKIRELVTDSISTIIFVDESHKEMFSRYQRYFDRPTRSFELNTKPSDLFVLYDGKVNSIDVTLKNKVKETELYNIVGKIDGKRQDEFVLFSAHYDHIGISSPISGDSIANGANDNASGVASIITLASYFQNQPKPERTLYFVGFTAEESGGYGSKYFSNQLNPDQIVAMFNIEMIGKPPMDGSNSAWITGFDYSTFGEILQNSVEDSSFVFYPDPYPNQNLFYRSDNATLARLGVPAHTISTTPIDVDEDYHQVSDESTTIDIPHTTKTIRAIAKAAEVITSGEKTPSRINPELVN